MDAAPAARIPRCQFPSGRSIFGDQRDVRVDEKGRGQPEVGAAVLPTDRPRVGHRPHTGLHPEPSVVRPVGIGDHGER